MATSKGQDEVQVTLEDQRKINAFARKNAMLMELQAEIDDIKKQLQNSEDASDDLLLLEDESESISFQIGEVFIDHSLDDTQELLEKNKAALKDKISELESECSDIKGVMKDLKIQLYAKFGDNINLEP